MIKKKLKRKRKKEVKNNWNEKFKKKTFWVIYRESRGRGGIKLSLRKRQQRKGIGY